MTVYSVKKQIEAALGPDVRSGRTELPLDDYQVVLDDSLTVDIELLDNVLTYALKQDMEKERELDQWLAPRVHFALRLPRRIAGDRGFWTWLTIKVGLPYTLHRWGTGEHVTMYRYTGGYSRNALARLWWYSEMARNGPSYAEVKNVLRDPSTAQYAMELKYSMYRPAVIAFGRVAAGLELGFDQMKALSKRINAYLSLRSLEALDLAEFDGRRDEGWWAERPTLKEVLDGDPQGPNDGFAPQAAIDELVKWFTSLAGEPKKQTITEQPRELVEV